MHYFAKDWERFLIKALTYIIIPCLSIVLLWHSIVQEILIYVSLFDVRP